MQPTAISNPTPSMQLPSNYSTAMARKDQYNSNYPATSSKSIKQCFSRKLDPPLKQSLQQHKFRMK